MKESDIQKAILDYLRYKKIFCWKNNSVGIYKKSTGTYIPVGMKGVADIIGIMPNGTFLAIEVKTKYRKPNENQKLFIENVKKNNGIAFVARNIEDVDKNLDK